MSSTSDEHTFSMDMSTTGEQTPPHPPLPPADHGKAANVIVLACAILQVPIWGFSGSYGVFREYYASEDELGGDIGAVGLVGNVMTGIIYLSMPPLCYLLTLHPTHRRAISLLGALLAPISLLLSAFATKIWHLMLTQGILHALGATMLYSSSTLDLDTWFLRRKGIAYGAMLASKSAVGVVTPFAFSAMLDRLGAKRTLLVWAAAVLVTSLPPACVLRPRQQSSSNGSTDAAGADTNTNANANANANADATASSRRLTPRKVPWTFATHAPFWILFLTTTLFSTGYILPQTYLPSYASSTLHLSPSTSALMLSLFSLPSVIASPAFGALSDTPRLSIYTVTAFSALGSAVPALVLWGLSADVGALAAFSVVYGFFAGGFSATWTGVLREVEREAARRGESVDTGLVWGLLNGGRGLGFVVGGFVGVGLLGGVGVGGGGVTGGAGWYSEYAGIILFTGVSAIVGAVAVLGKVGWNWVV